MRTPVQTVWLLTTVTSPQICGDGGQQCSYSSQAAVLCIFVQTWRLFTKRFESERGLSVHDGIGNPSGRLLPTNLSTNAEPQIELDW